MIYLSAICALAIIAIIGNVSALQCYHCYHFDCLRETIPYKTCTYGQVCTTSIATYGAGGGPTLRKDCDGPDYCANLLSQSARSESLMLTQLCNTCDSNYCNSASKLMSTAVPVLLVALVVGFKTIL